jgi:hypothetical protein
MERWLPIFSEPRAGLAAGGLRVETGRHDNWRAL